MPIIQDNILINHLSSNSLNTTDKTLVGAINENKNNIDNIENTLPSKQDTLIAGENITIENNVISATITNELPTTPTNDGIFALKCIVVNGTSTLEWVNEGIAFTIGTGTYVAENGMTWLQWVSSSYSNNEFHEDNGEIKNGFGDTVTYNGIAVTSSDTIINGASYNIVMIGE